MDDVIQSLDQALSQGAIDQTTYTNTKNWLDNSQLAEWHDQIKDLIAKGDWTALKDAFYGQIEFGTAGIRGRTGLGSARINSWTVGSAVQGLADYINTQGSAAKARGVVIGADTRLTSPELVKLVSDILTTNGIKVWRFTRPAQVGMFSYAIRLYKAQAGIYISASHNPPSDNGVKIYWEDGGQVLPPHDKAITERVKVIIDIKKDGAQPGLITEIGEAFDTTYRARVLQESVSPSRSAKIVYSPFHGTGQYGVLPILREAGFEVITVDEQMSPDGNFPNVPGGVPNPEKPESNALTAQKVLAAGADLGISTDPDADRLGLIVPKAGGTVILDGNQTVALLAYFIADRLKADNKLPTNGFMLRNITTTALIDAIAQDFGLKIYNTSPVGFKYFGELITKHEDFGDELYIYGGEESFGSLKGSYARDKDASSAALIAAEMVSWLKDNGRTVWDRLAELEERYGHYSNELINIMYEGAEGFATMQRLMASLRQQPPQSLGDWPVVSIIDRQNNQIKNQAGEVTGMVDDHPTNTLIFNLSDDQKNQVIIRPSGTEPKVKIYIALYNKTDQQITSLKAAIKSLTESLTR